MPVDPDILNLLRPWLTADDVTDVQAVKGGYVNEVYRIDAHGGPFALRIYSPLTTRGMACAEHALLAEVAAQIAEVPAPIPARDERGHCPTLVNGASLSLFVEGEHPDRTNAADRVQAARMLGSLHGVLAALDAVPPRLSQPAMADLDWRENRLWIWPTGKSIVATIVGDDAVAAIEAGLARCDEELARLAHHQWHRMPIHGDYYEGNLLIADGRIRGVLDWDEFRVDWRAWEVSNAVWSFCRNADNDDFERHYARQFIADYETTGNPLHPSVRTEMVALISLTRLWEALYAVGEAQRGGTPDWDYFAANLRAFEALRTVSPL